MFIFLAILTSFAAVTMLIAGILSFLRSPRVGSNRWFLLLSVALAIWVPTNFLDSNLTQSTLVNVLIKVDFSFALLMGWLFTQFTLTHLWRLQSSLRGPVLQVGVHPIFRFLSTTINLALIVFLVSGQIVSSTVVSGELHVMTGRGFNAYAVVVSSYFFYALFALTYAYVQLPRKERSKLDIILFGFSFATVANIATNLIFPALISQRSVVKDLNIIGYVGLLVLVACVYIAITRRRLFDIRFFAVRAAAYLFSVILVSLLYIIPSILLVAWIMQIHFTWGRFIAGVGVALVFALFYGRMRDGFNHLTTKLFYRGYYEPQDVLDRLSGLLVRTIDVEYLQIKSREILQQALRANDFRYWLEGAHEEMDSQLAHLFHKSRGTNVLVLDELTESPALVQQLHDNNVAVVVRLRTTHGNLGFITLGFKESGELYNERDKRLLSIAADEIAISLQNALHFEEIQHFNKTLQGRVDSATKELRQSNEKLKALDETKDDFISMASHQLRTPLTSVKGYLSLVLEGDAGQISEQQRKLLNQAFISSQRMVYLISDLLNVSRLKTGKFVIEPVPVNLAEVIEDEISQLVETAQSREITLSYDKPKDFPTLMFDETKTRQVIMNFIDNAIYYTPAGGHIRVELHDKPSTIELKVVDDGIGVPKSEQHHLFTKFYRAKNARQARPDGTGLGLFMAKKVITAQGGAIIFDSQEGKGSTFGFTFSKSKLAVKPPAPAATTVK